MLLWRCRTGALVSAIALAVITGCTSSPTPAQPPTVSSTPSTAPTQSLGGTPTVTPTWDADQTAAIDVVAEFAAADDKIGADPSAFTEKQMTELLKETSGGEALATTLRWHLLLKKSGYRLSGEMEILSTLASKTVDDGRGVEIHVTQCQDQRQGKVVDKDGNPVARGEFQIPTYNLRQFSVRKPPGEPKFRVFGFQTVNGKCP